MTPEETIAWHKRNDEQIEEDSRSQCEMYAKYDPVDYFTYQEPDFEKFPHEELYIDQAPYHTQYGDRTFFGCLLELGLKRKESWLIKQIQEHNDPNNSPTYSPEYIAKMIRCNPHLHNIIKTDLLKNLEIYTGYKGY